MSPENDNNPQPSNPGIRNARKHVETAHVAVDRGLAAEPQNAAGVAVAAATAVAVAREQEPCGTVSATSQASTPTSTGEIRRC